MARWPLLCCVFIAAPALAVDKTIVVLPLDISKTAGKMGPEARASLEEELRDEAANALAGSGWTVMTGETTIKILTDNGIDPTKCGEGSCHLDTAKQMNVEKFISGAVQFFEGAYTASVRLVDTKSGNILASARVEGKTVHELGKDFAGRAEKFFERSGLLQGDAAASAGAPAAGPTPAAGPAGPGKGTLKIVSAPSGAKVSIDGDPAGATPLSLKRDAGTYIVSIELPGYAPVSRQVDLAAGKAAMVSETLMQAAGYIEIAIAPDAAAKAASVTVDGKPAGPGKQGPYKVGKHAVRAEAQGYRAAEAEADVDNGGIAQVSLTLEAQPGKLLLSVNVAARCSAGAGAVNASTDTVTRLEVPAGPARVTCSAEGYEDASSDVEVGPGKARPVKLTLARVRGPQAGQSRTEPKTGLEFAYIPGGSFHLGCEPQDTKCYETEKPGRTVSVRPFWLGKTAVTVAAYAKCAAAGACDTTLQTLDTQKLDCNWKNGRQNHPINCIKWADSNKFCAWIGGRLPLAEEWERAAKGGESRIYPWGNEPPTGQRANFCDLKCHEQNPDFKYFNPEIDDGFGASAPVGSYPAGISKWGLLDMSGNVWNWTGSDYDAKSKELRGGAWDSEKIFIRSSNRHWRVPTDGNAGFGVRCLLPAQ